MIREYHCKATLCGVRGDSDLEILQVRLKGNERMSTSAMNTVVYHD